MKNRIRTSMLVLGVALLTNAGSSMAAVDIASNHIAGVTVTGYTNTGLSPSGGLVLANATSIDGCEDNPNLANCKPQTVWYGGGYGVTSSGTDQVPPNHALDNVVNTESLLLNFGTSKQLNSLTIGYKSGDADITLLAWKPSEYMNPANPVVNSPVLGATKYSDLLGLGWSLVGNYANLDANVAKSVNVSSPVSSSYWLVMAYNSTFDAAIATSSDTAARSYQADSTPDYFKLYSVAYSPGTKKVPEPSTALLMGAALFGLMRSRRLKA